MCKVAESEDPVLLKALFDAVITGSTEKTDVPQEFNQFNPDPTNSSFRCIARPTLKSLYVRMLQSRIAVPFAVEVLRSLPEGKEILEKELTAIIKTPKSFLDYHVAVVRLFEIRHPGVHTVHASAVEQIKMLLVRNGEVPGSVQMVNFNENDMAREIRLRPEDLKRVEPFEKAVIQAAETDLSIMSGLLLAMYNTNVRMVKESYIERVNQSGERILAALPKDQVTLTIKRLLKYNLNDDERKRLERIRLRGHYN